MGRRRLGALGPGGRVRRLKTPPRAPEKVASPSAPARGEVHERIAPHFCATRAKLAQLLGTAAATPAPVPSVNETAESAEPPTTSLGTSTKVAANQAYRAVAPGTVLIRTERGMGTGVVFDPRGYVITNNHVIADGAKEIFIVKVNVTFGDLSRTGRMSRQEKTYDGVVVKADPVRDLAIVKVIDPPAKLTTVKLAKNAPQIAEKVIAVGHAGIGFLWAAKTCNVASIGERQQDASMLASLDCMRGDPAQSPAELSRSKKSCEDRKKMVTEALLAQTQGLAVQAGQDPTQAFRIAKGAAALELDPKSVAGKALRHRAVFKDKAMGPKWKAIATKLFRASIVEE